VDRLAKGIIVVMYEVAFLRAEVLVLRKANEGFNKRRKAKKIYIYSLKGYLLYKMYRIYWIGRLWVSSWLRKNVKIVVVQGVFVRRFGIIAYTTSPVIMNVYIRRLQNRLIHLFPIQLLLFPNIVVV